MQVQSSHTHCYSSNKGLTPPTPCRRKQVRILGYMVCEIAGCGQYNTINCKACFTVNDPLKGLVVERPSIPLS
jgi:hypothetical protein